MGVFIQKGENVVMNVKLTNIGRKNLASGTLNFGNYVFGDSDIDYKFAKDNGLDISEYQIIRPKDSNPNVKYYLYKTPSNPNPSTTLTKDLINSVETIIVNSAKERGFFTGNTTTGFSILTDIEHSKGNATVSTNTVIGGTSMTLSNVTNLSIGDYIMVAWRNPATNAITYVNNGISNLLQYLWYKIENIVGNDVTVDRNLPNFASSGGIITSQVFFYPGGDSINNYYGSGTTTAYWNENTLSFNSTCNVATDDVVIWNMNNTYSETMAGTNTITFENSAKYGSQDYNGFKNYVSQTYDKQSQKGLGIIHFTNHSISNYYGESLYGSSFKINFPTIMYHRATGSTIGMNLRADITKKTTIPFKSLNENSVLNSYDSNLTTTYYDLIDESNVVVGKVFNDLKLATIEDEEILASLSYKSNRNWTLPKISSLIKRPVTGSETQIPIGNTVFLTYLFESNGDYSYETTLGMTTPLHCQYYVEQNITDTNGVLQFNFPFSNGSENLKYMRNNTEVNSLNGTGWNANKFKILIQIQPIGNRPDPNSWKIYDYTPQLLNYGVWGSSTIDKSTAFSLPINVDNNLINAAIPYDLNTYLNIASLASPNKLNFGDEVFAYANINTDIQAVVYRTKMILKLNSNEFNTTRNPTWTSGDSVYVSEVYINDNFDNPVAVGKLSYPVEKSSTKVIILEVDLDF